MAAWFASSRSSLEWTSIDLMSGTGCPTALAAALARGDARPLLAAGLNTSELVGSRRARVAGRLADRTSVLQPWAAVAGRERSVSQWNARHSDKRVESAAGGASNAIEAAKQHTSMSFSTASKETPFKAPLTGLLGEEPGSLKVFNCRRAAVAAAAAGGCRGERADGAAALGLRSGGGGSTGSVGFGIRTNCMAEWRPCEFGIASGKALGWAVNGLRPDRAAWQILIDVDAVIPSLHHLSPRHDRRHVVRS